MALDPVTAVLDIGGKLIDKLFPDPAQKAAAQIKLLELQQAGELTVLTEQSSIIKAEASSESWLARSWRPIVMLTFTALIVARWFGLAAPDLSQAEYLELWSIVKLGLGGYVIGRSSEKVVSSVTTAVVDYKGKK
jgi:Holin of 3TMs, for gene-transfer release